MAVDRPASPYFQHVSPGVVVARPAALEPGDAFARGVARLRRFAFGRPLANSEEAGERLTKVKALAVFSSDNLSSVAYATEAILFTLLAAGTQALKVVRRGTLTCAAVCTLTLVPASEARPPR